DPDQPPHRADKHGPSKHEQDTREEHSEPAPSQRHVVHTHHERSETRDEKEARQEADRRNLWQTPIHDPQPRSLRRVALLPLWARHAPLAARRLTARLRAEWLRDRRPLRV